LQKFLVVKLRDNQMMPPIEDAFLTSAPRDPLWAADYYIERLLPSRALRGDKYLHQDREVIRIRNPARQVQNVRAM